MRKSTRHIFNVILTFDHEDQEVFNFAIDSGFSELEFVTRIIALASFPTLLIKISTCLFAICDFDGGYLRGVNKDDIPEFLTASWGKYYFTDDNPHAHEWKEFRDQIITELINRQTVTSD